MKFSSFEFDFEVGSSCLSLCEDSCALVINGNIGVDKVIERIRMNNAGLLINFPTELDQRRGREIDSKSLHTLLSSLRRKKVPGLAISFDFDQGLGIPILAVDAAAEDIAFSPYHILEAVLKLGIDKLLNSRSYYNSRTRSLVIECPPNTALVIIQSLQV